MLPEIFIQIIRLTISFNVNPFRFNYAASFYPSWWGAYKTARKGGLGGPGGLQDGRNGEVFLGGLFVKCFFIATKLH